MPKMNLHPSRYVPLLLLFLGPGCGKGNKTPEQPDLPVGKAAIEMAIRRAADKPTGELTQTDLEKVKELRLGNTRITSLTPLKKVTKLERLHLQDNQISDLTPLMHLSKLEFLELDNNEIADLSPLKNLKQLKGLFLDNNQITELKPLMGLRGLQKLGLSSNHNLTRESVRRLEKVLNSCKVYSNAK
tara:strand:+ start:25 stop:585 length:561 start_codon:yes stop_codon:yes gene_type:complete